jgi:hypothetical protein
VDLGRLVCVHTHEFIHNVQSDPSPAPPAGKTSEVNVVQTTLAGKTKSRKGRGKNKEGKNNNPNEQTKPPPADE